MTASVKVGGAFHGLVGVKVRVAGTWRTTSKGFVKVAGTWRQWLASLITDTFTRANNASLGNTETGEAWSTLRGTAWGVVSNQASNSDAASNYPIATVPLGSADTTTSVSTSQGCGPAVWVTDANNWWASFHYSSSSTGCGGGATGWSTTDPVTCACGARQTQSVADCSGAATAWSSTDPVTCACGARETRAGTPSCTDYLALFGGGAAAQCAADGGTYTSPNCCFPTTEYRCSATAGSHTEYRCSDSTTTTTAHVLRVVKDVAGTISNVADASIASAPAAVKVVTSGNSITATAYSDTAMTSLLGTNAQTNTGTKGTAVGIVKAPGGLSQGSTVDTFSATI